MEIIRYNAQRLQNQFEVLKGTSTYILQGLFHAAARDWLKHLPEGNISDVTKLSGSYCAPYENYHFVVDGKIVQFTISLDYNCPVLFLGNDKEPVEKAVEAFGKFVQSQGLEHLVKKTAERLKKKQETFP